ncbi:L-threonylcarbamoyladenylate synthase [Spiroplasma endosymbiont of Nebria brevicollis]|uniref:L-threonylcarbamoyladenylate synthase n=1 Tax=Spiroplasma endosymbiont of Nebria brevicollis TaxID=3066284 RepID=UPI00313C4945
MITFKQNQILEISQKFNDSQVIALPTDTVYGLAAKYNDEKAIAEIYKIKNRGHNKPLPILVGSWEQAKLVGIISEDLQRFLTTNFKEGKVTVIVAKQPMLNTPYWITKSSVAIRVSASSFIKKITAILGPLVATSCNISNELPITDYKLINLPKLKYKVMGEILDNKPSTIYDSFTGKIIR